MPYEPDAVAQWITQRLSAVPAIVALVGRHPTKQNVQIYERVVPEGGTYPCILFVAVTGTFGRGTGGYRTYAKLFYEIKAVHTGESYGGVIAQLANLIDQTMQQAQDVTDDVVAGCSAVRPVQREDFEGNQRHNHYGAEYEVWAYSSSDTSLGAVVVTSTGVATEAQVLQAQIDALRAQLGVDEMSIHVLAGAKYAVGAPITATITVSAPTNSTSFGVNNSAAAVITLPIATGSGVDLEFIKTGGAGFAASFALNAADTSPGALANTALAAVGDVQAFRDIAANVWEAH